LVKSESTTPHTTRRAGKNRGIQEGKFLLARHSGSLPLFCGGFASAEVQDLQTIQSEVVYFWQSKERLPVSLTELRDDIRGFIPPLDPESGQPYGYQLTGPLSFELCAVFKTETKPEAISGKPLTGPPMAVPPGLTSPASLEIWSHQAGEWCFSRTIDPDLFPPFKNKK